MIWQVRGFFFCADPGLLPHDRRGECERRDVQLAKAHNSLDTRTTKRFLIRFDSRNSRLILIPRLKYSYGGFRQAAAGTWRRDRLDWRCTVARRTFQSSTRPSSRRYHLSWQEFSRLLSAGHIDHRQHRALTDSLAGQSWTPLIQKRLVSIPAMNCIPGITLLVRPLSLVKKRSVFACAAQARWMASAGDTPRSARIRA